MFCECDSPRPEVRPRRTGRRRLQSGTQFRRASPPRYYIVMHSAAKEGQSFGNEMSGFVRKSNKFGCRSRLFQNRNCRFSIACKIHLILILMEKMESIKQPCGRPRFFFAYFGTFNLPTYAHGVVHCWVCRNGGYGGNYSAQPKTYNIHRLICLRSVISFCYKSFLKPQIFCHYKARGHYRAKLAI